MTNLLKCSLIGSGKDFSVIDSYHYCRAVVRFLSLIDNGQEFTFYGGISFSLAIFLEKKESLCYAAS